MLAGAVDAARLRQSRAVEIVGEPGAGKSRLVEELASISVGFQFLRGSCEPYSASTPFGPFRAMLRPLIGALPDESRESAGAKLTAFAQTVMPDLAQWLPLLALPFDAEVADTDEVDQIDSVFRRDRLHDVLDQFLARMLLMPTVLLVEDVHWLDDASQLLLAKLAQPGPRPWLVVATRRPSGLPLAAADVLALELEPLGVAEARTLALAAAGDLALSEDQLAAVTERAAGNPLFIRELAIAPADDDALPETVESLLTIRIDTLEANDRLLLRHASVIGPTFDLDLLAEILPDEATDPEQWVRLADFVDWVGPGLLRFRHDLVRTAAYDGLSYARRREIHARVGDAIERRSAGGPAPADVLSLHFLEAGRFDEAWAYAVEAGDDARSKYANIDAATFYERALAAAGHFDPESADVARVCEALGDVREFAARYDDAEAAYGRALEHGGASARLLAKAGCRQRAPREIRRSTRAVRARRRWTRMRPRAWRSSSLGRSFSTGRERSTSARPPRMRAADGASALGDRATLADAYYVRAAAEGDRGGPAREYLDRALAIFDELGLLDRQGDRPQQHGRARLLRRLPGTRRSSSITAPRRSSGGPATCSPAAMRRTTARRFSSTRGAWTRRRSCSTSRCAPTGPRSSRPARRS